MTKLQLKKIEKFINKNICDITLKFDDCFYYDDTTRTIAIQKNYTGEGDNHFIAILKEKGLKGNYNAITLSLMHELGHANTLEYISNKKYDKCNAILDTLYTKGLSDKKFYKAYYKVYSEKVANTWAIKYINAHEKEIKKLEKLLDK